MTVGNSKYRMSISLGVLNHLGIGLYSNIPTVISEAVANAWDADATLVDITVDQENKTITIQDNGIGMSEDDANDKYLHVGYERRKADGPMTPKGRRVMGRKGVGKLSLFSIANTVTVYSKKEGCKGHGFKMDATEIKKFLNQTTNKDSKVDVARDLESHKTIYSPDSMGADESLKEGTKIILSNMRQQIRKTSALKNRLARRFTIIKGGEFEVRLDGEPIRMDDIGYKGKLQYMWEFGSGSDLEQGDDPRIFPLEPTVKIGDVEHTISGWIGTVKKPSHLKGSEGDNNNRIGIMMRGKLAQENILDDFEEGGVYTKYVVGVIHAEFLDEDDKDDITTTNRQGIKEEDERYIALRGKIWECLKEIQSRWTDLRAEEGHRIALGIPQIREWYDDLPKDRQILAKRLFGRINQLKIDDEGVGFRKQLFISSILAFESLRLRDMLTSLDKIDVGSLDGYKDIFLQLSDLEASAYYQITKQRLEVINNLESKVDENEKERIIQYYLFKNLWLLDPKWERLHESGVMEKGIRKAFDIAKEQQSEDVKNSRIDIKYGTVNGRHVIIELKRPERSLETGDLVSQIKKYRNKITNALRDAGRSNESLEFVCIIGKDLKDWKESPTGIYDTREILKPLSARIIKYDEIMDGARKAYERYLEEQEKVNRIYKLITSINEDDRIIV
ncbi:MAG: ATP-binding protein [Alphaproteobacteria bacterium]|nr:ATP-binding protein [Alphaproteobacteria bacterium]